MKKLKQKMFTRYLLAFVGLLLLGTNVLHAEETKVTFDFTQHEGGVSSGSGATYVGDGDITTDTLIVGDGVNIIVTPSTTSTPNRFWSDKTLRLYGGTMTFEAAEGLAITSISMTLNSSNFGAANTFNGVVPETKGQWEGNSTNVILTVAANTQIKTIVVTLDAKNDQTTTYEPKHIANTAETAYTVAEAFDLIDAGESLSETVYVKGIVSKVDQYKANYKSIDYWISDDGTTEGQQLEAYSGKGLNGADFTSVDDVKVGAEVIIKGTLTKYNTTYEFAQNNELVSYEEKGAEDPAVSELKKNLTDFITLVENSYNLDDLSDYTEESANALLKAVADAKAALADENATAESLNAALTALVTAAYSMEPADELAQMKEFLSQLIAAYEEEDLSGYTDESVANLLKAIEDVKAAVADPNATEESLMVAYMALAAALEGLEEKPVDEGNWETVGTAILEDPWVLPGLGIDQHADENKWEVPLQRNSENENLYRLVDPYHAEGPVKEYNQSEEVGYIVFDVTDPDHVLFAPDAKAGFKNRTSDIAIKVNEIYAYNRLTQLYYHKEDGKKDLATIIAEYSESIPFTTFKDGVITLGSITGNGSTIYDACFGDNTDVAGFPDGFDWENGADMTGSITLKIDGAAEEPGLTLPLTEDFEGETCIFEGGEVFDAGALTHVLLMKNATATANLYGYAPAEDEEVKFQFTAYQGWESGDKTATVSITNTEGETLVSYTYGLSACNVTDVTIGGETVNEEAFFGQSNTNGSKSANIFGHSSQPFLADASANPMVTMSITGAGVVKFDLEYTSNSGEVKETFTGTLPEGTKVDLGSIVVKSTATAASFGIDNLSITSATVVIDTGVTTAKTQTENGAIYNLQGQKVVKAQKGLYIINGKKVVIK